MADSVINNKRIAINTIFLYVRMILTTLISLYTVRVVLDVLGVVDYGIYNVVGSVVALAGFLNGSMTAASNRFFSVEIAHKNSDGLSKIFSLNIIVFTVLLIILVLLTEIGGVWYLNNKMMIPIERLYASNWVLQFSILSLALSIITVPYTSMVITHEKMSVFAYISIFESIARLIIAILLSFVSFDKLIYYGFLQCVVTLSSTLFYFIYCRINYIESKFKWYWSIEKFKELMSFTGWFFLGSTSVIIKSQGVNLIINAFFNPAINAARGIAYQVETAVIRFSDSFFTAAKPQIYMAYANKEFSSLMTLLSRTTIMCAYLMIVIAVPLAINADFVLSIWLKEVPPHTILFLQLILIDGVINAVSNPTILTIVASGHIKYYQIAEFILRVVTLPLCYFMLCIVEEPEVTVVVSIVLSISSYIMRAYMLKRELAIFDFAKYLLLSFKIICIAFAAYYFTKAVLDIIANQILYFTSTCFISVILITFSVFYGVMPSEDRFVVVSMIKKKLGK